jgi:SPP1 gp7 family putative phage head morphogenesis protein
LGILNKPRDFFYPILSLFRNSAFPDQSEILKKNLERNYGLEYELENPDTLLEDKGKDVTFYDKIMLDDRIKSIIELKKKMVLAVDHDFVPASDDERDMEINDFIRWQFNEALVISFDDILDNFLDAMIYGYKVAEKIFDTAQSAMKKGIRVPSQHMGKWFLTNIKHKHSVFFDFDYDEFGNLNELIIGRMVGFTDTVEGIENIKEKFIIFVYPYPKDSNYYGDSDLKEIYTQYYSKFHIFRYRNQFLEKWGAPIPEVIYDKKKVSAVELTALKNLMKNFQDAMFFINPGEWNNEAKKFIGKFEFIIHEAKSGRPTDQFEKAIEQIDTQIARKLLIPDKMGFTSSDGGSYALGKTQFNILVNIIEDLQHKLENLVNPLIKQLVDYNYPNVSEYPTFRFEQISKMVEHEMLTALIANGIIDPAEKWIRKYTGIPELSKKEIEEIEDDKIDKPKPPALPEPKEPAIPGTQNEFKNIFLAQTRKEIPKSIMDVKKIERFYIMAEEEFKQEFSPIYLDLMQGLIKQIQRKKIIEDRNTKAIDTLRVKKTDLKKLLENYYGWVYFNGRKSAINELKKRLPKAKENFKAITFQLEESWLDRRYLASIVEQQGELGILTALDKQAIKDMKDRAFFITGSFENDMLKDVGNIIHSGLRAGEVTKDIINKIEEKLTTDKQRFSTTIARTNASDFYNTGRMNTFESDGVREFVEAYMYSAIIDDRTTLFCEHHDGQVIKKGDSELSFIVPPNHFNCRSILVPILTGESQIPGNFFENYQDDFLKWDAGISGQFKPAEGFGK